MRPAAAILALTIAVGAFACGWALRVTQGTEPLASTLGQASTPGGPATTHLTFPGSGSDRSGTPPPSEGNGPVGLDATDQPSSVLVIHVAGAVAHPGVYRLGVAARVDDALRVAGGPASDADLDRVNLAAPLTDGARLYVPRLGEDQVPEVVATPGDSGPSADGGAPGAGPSPVDLNRASPAELESLPGIGPTLAAAIVAYREEHGPFRSVEQVTEVSGIGPARLAQIRDLITVGRA